MTPNLRSLLIFGGLLVLSAGALWFAKGAQAVVDSAMSSLELLVSILPIVIAAMVMSGYFQELVPREKVTRHLGEDSGFRGLLVASLAGAATPGGPFAAFPLVAALYQAGAGIGATVAYLTAWSVLGVNRMIVWEIPILGPEVTALRYLVSIPLPILAGMIATRLAKAWPRPAGEERP